MKTSLALLTFAVAAALVLAVLNIEIAAAVLFAASLISFAMYDYTRPMHPWAAAPAVRGIVKRHRKRLGLAA